MLRFLLLTALTITTALPVLAQTSTQESPPQTSPDQSAATNQSGGDVDSSADADTASADAKPKPPKKIDTGMLASALKFRSIGPAFMSGRIGDVAIDPAQPNTWYVAVASGGVWKTKNAGTTFQPIFDKQKSYSIGCVTIDPANHSTVWVGTGENNGGRHIGFGDGIYVSLDSGTTWEHRGLKESEHISKILVDPRDSNVVLAASQGPLWSSGGQRGLYRTTDAGKTWQCVLSKGEYTGVTDVVMDPQNPDVLYAATHQRHRNVWAIINCGPETGIHKSVDGGKTWKELKNGLPTGDMGKISLQVSPQKTNVVYATIELPGRKGGFYRSKNYGASWQKTSDFVSGGTGPHYYQELWTDPHRYGVLYQANNSLVRSTDDGKTWNSVEGRYKHVDNHAIGFHPTDPDFLLVGCDGGLYRSYDYCKTWLFCPNLPLTQFYKVAVDYDYPFYNIAGGTQDNNSQYGPSRTQSVGGIRNSDWIKTVGGDGHDTAIDPEDPNTIYAESQQGYLRRYDRKTGESVVIQPRPDQGQAAFRFNWDSPILISPHSHTRLYFASQHLHRSDDRGDSWKTVSPDLSRNRNRYELPTMGRVPSVDAAYDLYAMSQHGNITSIAESPIVQGLLYVGTDDGLIQISEDGGQTWRKVEKIFGVPEFFFVNDIKADLHDADTVYACVDDHKTGDYRPYVLRSTDRGRTWETMVGNLPDRHICWRLVQDHQRADLFFLATEFGIFATLDAGQQWFQLKSGLPTISFRDLEIQTRENDLVAASFGRSFYVLDDFSLLREATHETFDKPFHLFPVRRAFWYAPSDPLGGAKGYQGDSFYSAKNPEYGAVFNCYIGESFESKAAQRKKKEASLRTAGKDIPTVSIDQIRAEREEVAPKYFLQITDANGIVVAKISLADGKGIKHASWNLRYQGLTNRRGGPMVAPGTYTVQAWKMTDGQASSMAEPLEFEVESIIDPTLPVQDRTQIIELVKKIGQTVNRTTALTTTLGDRIKQINDLIKILGRHPQSTAELIQQAHELKRRASQYQRLLNGDPIKSARWIVAEPGINARIRSAMSSAMSGTYGPTGTAMQQYEIGLAQFAEIQDGLRNLIEDEFEAFQEQLDEARIPWTPGRSLPK